MSHKHLSVSWLTRLTLTHSYTHAHPHAHAHTPTHSYTLTHTEPSDDLNAEKMSHFFFRCSPPGHHRQGREGRFWKESLSESPCPKIFPTPSSPPRCQSCHPSWGRACACVCTRVALNSACRDQHGHIQCMCSLAEVPRGLVLEEQCARACTRVCTRALHPRV